VFSHTGARQMTLYSAWLLCISIPYKTVYLEIEVTYELTFLFSDPQVFVRSVMATQHGLLLVPPVQRDPNAQQVSPQHEVGKGEYEQQTPFEHGMEKLGQNCL